MAQCTPAADNVFGPAVGHGCRDDFDFTLLFEQSFFQIAPSALLLLIIPLRASQLRRQSVKVLRNGSQSVKQAAIAILAATQLALLILWSLTPIYRTRASIPAASLSFVASLALLYLSSIEHARSIRPSSIINMWILFSLLFDLPQARTLWLRSGPISLPTLFTIGVAAKVAVLYLEARNKRRSLFPAYRLSAPESLVSLYDRTALWWINPLFWTGYRDFLTIDTLYTLDDDLSSERVEKEFTAQWEKQAADNKWGILWATFASVKWTFFAMVIPRLCLSALKLSQPLLITRVTTLLREGLNDNNANQARGLIGAAALIYIGVAITTAMFQRALHRLVTKIRGALIAAIYAKSLRLDSSQLADNAALTHVTADVNRVGFSLTSIDELFATPIELGVAIFLLQRQIGISCVAPIAIAVSITAISFVNSNSAVLMQKSWMAAVSARVAYTSSVLGSPKGFKMLGLTEYFISKIQALRVHELVEYAQYRKYVTWRNVFSNMPNTFAPPFTLMMFTLLKGGDALDPTTAFTSLALVALLTSPTQELIHAVPELLTALASLERVQTFLRLEGNSEAYVEGSSTLRVEADDSVELATFPSGLEPTSQHSPILSLLDASVNLGEDKKDVLRNISLELQRNNLTLLVGPVGCGKSTLLRTIIGDLQLSSGSRAVNPGRTFAYCAQDAWLPNDTIRNIIIGQSELDENWYLTVIKACALSPDIASFPAGHETLVGTKGVSLSGGQRQRVALARAVYARREILVADEVFSGLDANTSRQVFAQVFGERGLCKKYGTTVLLATHSQQYLQSADFIVALGTDGGVVEQGTFDQLDAAGGYVHRLRLKGDQSSHDTDEIEDAIVEKATTAAPDKVELAQQDLARKTGDTAVYKYYLTSIGPKFCFLLLLCVIAVAFGEKFPDLWVRLWSEASSSEYPSHPLGVYIGVSFLVASVSCFAGGANVWIMLIHAVTKSSAQLHKQLLDAVMHATYKFFVTTDSGVTLNRFSNDMAIIERELAGAFLQVTGGVAVIIASAMLIVAGADYAAAALPFVILALYLIQKFYLRTSRQLRFLELESQAPLLTHVSETLAGVTTIRAFGWQHQSHQRCITLLDRSQKAYYLMLCIQRWLNFVLALVTAAVAVIIVSMALTIPRASSAGAVGVSLLGILNFSWYLSYMINAWTALETSLGAVARCKNFEASTVSEDKAEECHEPPADWPREGKVVFQNVSAAYSPDENVLNSISLSIAAGEKLGICGRSGSGKSSLLLTLFRLLDAAEGRIEIDGIDLSTLPRRIIRERLTALPQETVTFPGTVRANLDPLDQHPASRAEETLRKVGLWDTTIAPRGGLDADMGSMSFSHGQLQLFAVARALLRKSNVVVLDEMTSAVDAVTEEGLLDLIRGEFEGRTVIAVAHRLKTIVGFDRVVVLDAGRVVEVGRPGELLGRDGGVFRGMWERSGERW